jgi:hypothetical protein
MIFDIRFVASGILQDLKGTTSSYYHVLHVVPVLQSNVYPCIAPDKLPYTVREPLVPRAALSYDENMHQSLLEVSSFQIATRLSRSPVQAYKPG